MPKLDRKLGSNASTQCGKDWHTFRLSSNGTVAWDANTMTNSITSARDINLMLSDKKKEKSKPVSDFRSLAAEIKEDKNENAGNDDNNPD